MTKTEEVLAGNIPRNTYFCLQDMARVLKERGYSLSSETLRKKLAKAVEAGELEKAGRNLYRGRQELLRYVPACSAYAEGIGQRILSQYPGLDFSLWELTQLNEFVNHQIAHNVVFVAAEAGTEAFIFDTLREAFFGKVLLRPTPEIYHRYRTEDMIVITRLISQCPVDKRNRPRARLETVLVDLVAEPVLKNTVSEGEYPRIYETAFHRYMLDEKSLFRYAGRRHAEEKIRRLIAEKTDIKLRTEA